MTHILEKECGDIWEDQITNIYFHCWTMCVWIFIKIIISKSGVTSTQRCTKNSVCSSDRIWFREDFLCLLVSMTDMNSKEQDDGGTLKNNVTKKVINQVIESTSGLEGVLKNAGLKRLRERPSLTFSDLRFSWPPVYNQSRKWTNVRCTQQKASKEPQASNGTEQQQTQWNISACTARKQQQTSM